MKNEEAYQPMEAHTVEFYKRCKEKYPALNGRSHLPAFPRLPEVHLNPKEMKYVKMRGNRDNYLKFVESVERGFFKRLSNWEHSMKCYFPTKFKGYIEAFSVFMESMEKKEESNRLKRRKKEGSDEK